MDIKKPVRHCVTARVQYDDTRIRSHAVDVGIETRACQQKKSPQLFEGEAGGPGGKFGATRRLGSNRATPANSKQDFI